MLNVLSQSEPRADRRLPLQLLAAQIFTWNNGIAVELFQIKELIPGSLNESGWLKFISDIEKTLTGRLSLEYRLAEKTGRLFSKTKGRDIPSKVLIDNEGSDFYTVIEVYTKDRAGLLYTLAKTLFDAGLNIKSAKISTKVDQIVDVFYVQDFYGQKITHPEQCQEIKKALLFKLDGNKKADKPGGCRTYDELVRKTGERPQYIRAERFKVKAERCFRL